MAFKVSYNITAIDGFSRVIKKIQKNFSELNKKISGSGGVFKNANSGAATFSSILNDIKQKGAKASEALGKMSTNIKTRQPNAFNRVLQNIGNTAGVVSGKVGKMFEHLKPKGFGELGVKAGVAATAAYGIKEGSEIELMTKRLAKYVGGNIKANETMNSLRSTSVKYGMGIDTLTESLHKFIDAGMKTPEAMKRLKQMADISALSGKPAEELARVFGQVKATGFATSESFDVLLARGINLREMMAKEMHIDPEDPFQMKAVTAKIESGIITSEEFNKLLEKYMKLHDVSGFAVEAVQTPMGQINRSWLAIKDSISSIGQMIGDFFIKPLTWTANAWELIAEKLRSLKDNFPNLGGVIFSGAFIILFISKLLAVRKILSGIRGIFMGTNTVLGVLVDAAKAFVKPFVWLGKFLGKILGFLTKIVGVAASFGLGAAKKAKAIIAPAAKSAVKSPVARKIATAAGAAAAANPIFDAVTSIVIPETMGDATRLDKLIDMKTYDLSDKYPKAISSAENINKSHVKIEFESKDAKINAIKQKDDSKNTFFDMSALGLNTFRGSY